MFTLIARLIRIVSQQTSGVLTIEVEVLSPIRDGNMLTIDLNARESGNVKNRTILNDILVIQGYYLHGTMRGTKITVLSDFLPKEILNFDEVIAQRGEPYRRFLSGNEYQDYNEIGDFPFWWKE